MYVTLLAIDLAKRVFQLHGINAEGKAILKKRLSRSGLVKKILYRRQQLFNNPAYWR